MYIYICTHVLIVFVCFAGARRPQALPGATSDGSCAKIETLKSLFPFPKGPKDPIIRYSVLG